MAKKGLQDVDVSYCNRQGAATIQQSRTPFYGRQEINLTYHKRNDYGCQALRFRFSILPGKIEFHIWPSANCEAACPLLYSYGRNNGIIGHGFICRLG